MHADRTRQRKPNETTFLASVANRPQFQTVIIATLGCPVCDSSVDHKCAKRPQKHRPNCGPKKRQTPPVTSCAPFRPLAFYAEGECRAREATQATNDRTYRTRRHQITIPSGPYHAARKHCHRVTSPNSRYLILRQSIRRSLIT